jgi:uncharacterized membrane protein
MKNRSVGLLVIGMALLVGFIIYMFNRALTSIVNESCSHGPTCPMWGTIDFQTYIGIGIIVFIVLVGLYFVFFAKDEEQVSRHQVKAKKVTKEDYESQLKELKQDEKLVFEKILESEGTIFQSDLVEKTGFQKVKVTRILDRLEGKGIIERKRRGMTNVVILKH